MAWVLLNIVLPISLLVDESEQKMVWNLNGHLNVSVICLLILYLKAERLFKMKENLSWVQFHKK